MNYMSNTVKFIFVLFTTFFIGLFLSKHSSEISLESCIEYYSDRMYSEEVNEKYGFEDILVNLHGLPTFETDKSYQEIVNQLNDYHSTSRLTVDCVDNSAIHFSLKTSSNTFKGFYKLKSQKYWSGPFSNKKVTVIIQADQGSKVLKIMKKGI